MILNSYLKFVVSLLGGVAVLLQTAYGSAHWATTVTAGITAVLVYLTPNAQTPKGPAS